MTEDYFPQRNFLELKKLMLIGAITQRKTLKHGQQSWRVVLSNL